MDLKGQAGHEVSPISCMAVRRKPLGEIIEKFQMKYECCDLQDPEKSAFFFSSLVNVDVTRDVQSLDHKHAFK